MNNFTETSLEISKLFANLTFPIYVEYIQNGYSDVRNIWKNENWDDHLENFMNNYWENLTDVHNNPYWTLDNATGEDKWMVFSKLKKVVLSSIHQHYQELVNQVIKTSLDESTDLWNSFKETVINMPSNRSSSDMWNLRNQIDQLFVHYSNHEKIKLVSESPQNYANVSLSTPTVQNIHIVSRHLPGIGLALHEPAVPIDVDKRNDEHSLTEASAAEEITSVYVFKRTLKGGVVENFPPNGAFVPESDIRKKNIEHGDKLKLVKIHQNTVPVRYDFAIAEKDVQPLPQRVQFNHCILEKDGRNWFVAQYEPYRNIGKTTRLEITWKDAPYQILISDADVDDFKIKAGDRIDVAFWENNPQKTKVIWHHRDE